MSFICYMDYDLFDALGDRPAALMRELTKKFETAERGTLFSLAERFEQEPPRGECVIAVLMEKSEQNKSAASLDDTLRALLESGASVKDAAAQAAKLTGTPKKVAYARSLTLKEEL